MSPKNAVSISVLFCWFGFSWSYSFPAGISLSFGERRERGCVDAAFTLSSSLAAPSPSRCAIFNAPDSDSDCLFRGFDSGLSCPTSPLFWPKKLRPESDTHTRTDKHTHVHTTAAMFLFNCRALFLFYFHELTRDFTHFFSATTISFEIVIPWSNYASHAACFPNTFHFSFFSMQLNGSRKQTQP